MIKRILLAASIAALSCAAFAQKVSELPAGTAVGGTEMIPAVQTGSTVRLTPAQLDTYISATTKTLTNKSISGASNTITNVPISTGVSGLGTGVATALGIAVGSAGAPVVQNGALGTPSSGVANNLTGTASGLTAGNVTTNANLTGDVTSVGNAATLATVNGNVGSFGSATQSLTATVNGKGLITAVSAQTVTPALGSITGLGTGVATFLATPSSTNLAAALTDENGSGKVQFSAGTLDVASGKTATFSNTLTFTGTDASSVAFGTGGTVDYVLTPTAVKTTSYTAAVGDLVPVDTTSGSVTITLPTAPANKSMIAVKQIIRGGTNTVSVVTGGSDVFNRSGGPTTATLTLTGQAGTYQYNSSGAIWYIVADDMPYASVVANANTWTGIQTFTTPVLGAATATSINGNTFTTGTYTLTGSASKTLNFTNSITLSGTDSTTMTFPSTSATVARTDAGQTFTGTNVFGVLQSGPHAITGSVGSSAVSITGATQTSSFPVLDATQTWSNVSTTFTGIKLNVTDTNSASGSLLIDLQVGSTSKFKVDKTGIVTVTDTYRAGSGGGFEVYNSANRTGFFIGSGSPALRLSSGGQMSFSNSTTDANSVVDTIVSRGGVATFQHGAADTSGAPVAQTITVQSVAAGTSNTAGASWTFAGSKGTGTGAGGSIIFQVAPAGSTGSSQNALATALTIDSTKLATFAAGGAFTGGVSVSTLTVSQGQFIQWTGRAAIDSPSDGVLRLTNNAQNAPGALQLGSTNLTLTGGALGIAKITASASAPGASGGKVELVCGTNAGSAKLIAYAGTSSTAVTIVDNIGSGVSGC